MVEKFPTSSSKNISDNRWSSSVSKARGFHSWISSSLLLNLAQTHKNIRTERQAWDIFCLIRRRGISCDSHQLYESKWTIHSSITCISKKIYEMRTDEWHTTWITPRVPSLGVDTERDLHPAVSSIHWTYKTDKKRSCYLGTRWALFTHNEPGGHYFSLSESCWNHLPPTS